MNNKANILFIFLAGVFITNALLAEFIGVKIFSLERAMGSVPLDTNSWWPFPSFNLTAGVLLWPFVFILTDIINEYFGKKGVKMLSFLTVGLIAYSFIMITIAIQLTPADFWISSYQPKVDNMQNAYSAIFGQGAWIIVGSIAAFLVGQILDVYVFHKIKMITGEKYLWLRATGSTLISQLVDSFVVLFIAFYLSGVFTFKMVIAIGFVNYIYKFIVAVCLTPILYLMHNWIDKYLGKSLATKMIEEAKMQD